VRGRNDKYVELVVLASGGAEVEEGLVEPLITDVRDALGIEVISFARGSGDMQGIPLK
jgi:hypothetical protein